MLLLLLFLTNLKPATYDYEVNILADFTEFVTGFLLLDI